jgi:hypothetical protein
MATSDDTRSTGPVSVGSGLTRHSLCLRSPSVELPDPARVVYFS